METETLLTENSLPQPEENHTQADFIKNEMNFDIDPDDPYTKASLADDPPVDEWMDILGSGQLKKKILIPGKENSRPNRGDTCVITLCGRLEDGTVVEEENDLMIHLGDVDVIQGLDLALALMNVGEEAEVQVGPRFAYGSLGRKSSQLPEIPPDANLTYNVILKSTEIEADIEELPHEQKRAIGNKKRERGNWWFARDEYTLAIQCYRKSLEYLLPGNENDLLDEKVPVSTAEPVSDADLQAMLEDVLKVHNNLAMAQLKCGALDAALNSVENVLRCQPQNVKALFRKGKILHNKGEYVKACAILTQALKIEPENKAIQQELAVITKKKVKDANHEKNLYRKMLGASSSEKKSNVQISTENKKVSKKITWSLLGGTIVAMAGIIAYKFIS